MADGQPLDLAGRELDHDAPEPRPRLRERKKLATREALSVAALRLALERGPGNVRVDDIADAAGVSPRTYNNYFSSREQAIVAAMTAERVLRIAAALRARPATEPLAIRVALQRWVSPPAENALADKGFLVVTDRPLPELLREALDWLAPARRATGSRGDHQP
ncbi:helix-turn-helix domain-containing protein [Amycolatopsis sp. NPDC051371]|uniref:TetR/AcrR family transcriptional regulator n=1 Tax=Amycolatopsis sp. NPDC051371 TaxID=3155800 RepID=UPI00341E368D